MITYTAQEFKKKHEECESFEDRLDLGISIVFRAKLSETVDKESSSVYFFHDGSWMEMSNAFGKLIKIGHCQKSTIGWN